MVLLLIFISSDESLKNVAYLLEIEAECFCIPIEVLQVRQRN